MAVKPWVGQITEPDDRKLQSKTKIVADLNASLKFYFKMVIVISFFRS